MNTKSDVPQGPHRPARGKRGGATSSGRTGLVSVLLLALALIPTTAGAIPDPIKGDFRVDQRTNDGDALGPSVSADRAGKFIVAWLAGGHIYARQFDRKGNAVTQQFQVDPDEPGVTVEYPRIVMHPAGSLAYLVYGREAADGKHVMLRLYQPHLHRFVGVPMQMDSDVPNAEYPNLAIDKRGRQVGVVWTTMVSDNSYLPYFRTLTQTGEPIGTPVPLALRGTLGVSNLNPAYVTALADENFMVVWSEIGSTGCYSGALLEAVAQRVNAQGTLDESFCIAQASIYETPGLPVARYVAAAGCPDGRLRVAWTASYPGEYHVFERPYDNRGNATSAEASVDQGDPAYEALMNHVACDSRGVFVHTWLDNPHGGSATAPRSDLQIYARRSGDDDHVFSEFRADSGPAGSVRLPNLPDVQILPDVAASTTNLVFVWVDWRAVGSDQHAKIFASVFANPPGPGF
jgi:hypothetical protein